MTRYSRTAFATGALVLGLAVSASAQTSRVAHGDVAGTAGWLATGMDSNNPYDTRDWTHSFLGAASAGWHWTDNVKTEVDFGAGTEARVYGTQQITAGGRTSYIPVTTRVSRRTLGLSLQYQFFHNVWFHPHLAAGVNLSWDRTTNETGPIYVFDDVSRTTRSVAGTTTDGPHTALTPRPFVAAGFKAYMTERTFFRSDFRVAFRHRVDETALRVGFGFDF